MKERTPLPTPRQLGLLVAGVSARVSIASLLAMSLYLYLLLRLAPEQWLAFGKIVALLFGVLFAAVCFVTHRMQQPLLRYLTREAQGSAGQAELHRAYARLTRLPLWMSLSGVLWWAGGGGLVALAMGGLFPSLGAHPLLVMVSASTSGGAVSMVFSYYMYKAALADLTSALGGRIGDAGRRRELHRSVSLGLKTIVSVAAVVTVTVFFATQLSLSVASQPLEAFATRLQLRFLEQAQARVLDDGLEALPALAEQLARSGVATGLALIDTGSAALLTKPRTSSGVAPLREDELARILAGPARGDSTSYDSVHAFAWLKPPGAGFAIVAYAPLDVVAGDRSEQSVAFALTMLLAVALASAVARLLARDVTRSARDLRDHVDRTASGDLRPVPLVQAEDEIGDLAVAFDRMRDALYATVSGVVAAADRVDSTAGRIRLISGQVEAKGREQARSVERTRESIGQLEAQGSGISTTVEGLNTLVEGASLSVVGLASVGQTLSDTADVLSERVLEETSSIEEMVASVRQVGENTDALTHAAAETSSSMQQMAASMREVDNTAEEVASLSGQVARAAEAGQVTMTQTVDAMESIRSATETAEGVIGALGRRAGEIDAIVDVIDSVADETSLLALNAAIIAAQAGEHGRAFSVVASEIKQLADRVQKSTKEIGELVRSVQGESSNAMSAIELGASSVAVGMQRVSEARTSLQDMTRASRESGDRIVAIVKAVREQTKAAIHVVTMMEHVNDGTVEIQRAITGQRAAHDVVHRSSRAIGEVASEMRSATSQQSLGSEQIRESIGGVRTASESIRELVGAQLSSCAEIALFLDGASGAAHANEESAGQLCEATGALIGQAESLREEVKRFKL